MGEARGRCRRPPIDDRLEDSAHRAQARYLLARRDRLVARINEIIDCPDLFWRHDYFRHCLGGIVVSAEEAVDEVRRCWRWNGAG